MAKQTVTTTKITFGGNKSENKTSDNTSKVNSKITNNSTTKCPLCGKVGYKPR